MDGSLAIEANRIALKRIVAMLTDMAGLGDEAPSTSRSMGVRSGRPQAGRKPTAWPPERRTPGAMAEGRPVDAKRREGVSSMSRPPSDDGLIAHVSDNPHSGLLRKPPLPLKGVEEGRPTSPPPLPLPFETNEEEGAAYPPPLPLPRRSGERWPAERDGEGVDLTRDGACRVADPHPEARAEGAPRRTIPRILWRAILALLRPAESAARRLIIAASRGLTVPPPRPRPPKPATMEPLLRKLGIAVTVAPANAARDGISSPAKRGRGTMRSMVEGALPEAGCTPRIPTFSLFDPPHRLALHGQRRHTVPPHAAPRICVPGLTEPAHLPPPPAPDDLVSAEHVTRRLAALSAALDDLPRQAKRFARWKASRDAQRDTATPRRISPLRRGRPPGGRLSRYDPSITHPPNIREIDEILAHTHSLALYALESPDTS